MYDSTYVKSIEVWEVERRLGAARRVPVGVGTDTFVGMMTEFGWRE